MNPREPLVFGSPVQNTTRNTSFCKRKRPVTSTSTSGIVSETDLCPTSRQKMTYSCQLRGKLRSLEVLCLIYRLAYLTPCFDYTKEEAICEMAAKMTGKCSVVSSVWLAIKYLGRRPFIPNADAMARAARVHKADMLAAEKRDLKTIQWNLSQFTTA